MSQPGIQKAIVAVVGAGVAIAAAFGLDVDEGVSTAIVTLVTAIAVYLVPNKP